MTGVPGYLFESGDICLEAGTYLFNGYIDGSPYPLPMQREMKLTLAVGQIFPGVHSAGKACWWILVESYEPELDYTRFAPATFSQTIVESRRDDEDGMT